MLLAISIGNTNLRYAVFDGTKIVRRGRCPVDQAVDFAEELAANGGGSDDHAVAASVRDDGLAAVAGAFESRGDRLLVVGREVPLALDNRYEQPSEVGIDRLLAVLAAARRYPGEAVAVVDFGTAVSVSVGSADGAFLGGLIGIGATTAARALTQFAPQLPRVRLEKPSGFIARDTSTAINDGLVWEVVGGVERVLRGIRESLSGTVRVIATGGDASLVAEHVQGIDEVVPDLVLLGIAHAYREWKGET